MASVLPSVSDCCGTCVCNVVEVELPCPPGEGGPLVVENLSALRLVLSYQRTPNMYVVVLGYESAMDGLGWTAIWREDSILPDAPLQVVRPADVLTDADPGRFEQYV